MGYISVHFCHWSISRQHTNLTTGIDFVLYMLTDEIYSHRPFYRESFCVLHFFISFYFPLVLSLILASTIHGRNYCTKSVSAVPVSWCRVALFMGSHIWYFRYDALISLGFQLSSRTAESRVDFEAIPQLFWLRLRCLNIIPFKQVASGVVSAHVSHQIHGVPTDFWESHVAFSCFTR